MGVKFARKKDKNITGNSNLTKTTGQIDKDVIPAKDKNPDDMEIVE